MPAGLLGFSSFLTNHGCRVFWGCISRIPQVYFCPHRFGNLFIFLLWGAPPPPPDLLESLD